MNIIKNGKQRFGHLRYIGQRNKQSKVYYFVDATIISADNVNTSVFSFIQSFPQDFTYQFVSLGSMIRDQINKHTNYSKMILQNLAKQKKVNDRILQILLKSAALQGDFMIKFAPKDESQIETWKKFMDKITIKLIVILNEEVDQSISKRSNYQQKIKQHQSHIKIYKNSGDQSQQRYNIQNNESNLKLIVEKIKK